MKTVKALGVFLLLFVLLFSIAGCNFGSTNEGGDCTHPEIDENEACTSCGKDTTPDGDGGEDNGDDGENEPDAPAAEDECSIKILFITDQSVAATPDLLWDVLIEEGYEKPLIAKLNASGADIAKHKSNIEIGAEAYTYAKKISEWEYLYRQNGSDVISSIDWDHIVVCQSIAKAADTESYENLSSLLSTIGEMAPEAKLHLNLPWSYNSSDVQFKSFDKDNEAMYLAAAGAVSSISGANSSFNIIPTGTVIQNIRAARDGDIATLSNSRLTEAGQYAVAMLLYHELTGGNIADVSCPESAMNDDIEKFEKIILEAVGNGIMSKLELNAPKIKSIKILIFGNSYGNDASRYLEAILRDGGYEEIVIGHVGESSMAINDHYHNIDDDPENDYVYSSTGKTFSVHYKTVNGEKVQMEADYKAIVADEKWDYITFYQGPNSDATLTQDSYYSELDNFVSALRKYSTNPECKIIYYMTWAHNVKDTTALYNGIIDVTKRLVLTNKDIDGIIPAATLIENLRSSYLLSGAGGDITRDWGHLNYGVGRYSMALLWYAYLTGGNIEDISYMPTKNDVSTSELSYFTPPAEHIDVIREAVKGALDNPFEVTKSKYTEEDYLSMTSVRNVSYVEGGADAQKLDIYLPCGKEDFPTLVFFHGGGFKNGDKARIEYGVLSRYFTSRGIAFVSANYRMYPDAKFPDFIVDCASAVAWVKENISKYGGGDVIYVGGSSAGAYASMLLCYDSSYLGAHGIAPTDIAAYIHDAGQPTKHFNVLAEDGIPRYTCIVDEAAPLYHLGRAESYSPQLLLCSDNDILCRYEETMLLISTYKALGYDPNKISFKLMEGYSHTAYLGDTDDKGVSVFGEIVYDFLKNI